MTRPISHRQTGFTLVELMIAMVLGLLVMIGVTDMYLSNIRTFRTSENMAGLQENARVSFEMLARDIREAGSTPCGAQIIVNTLKPSPPSTLAQTWNTVLRGYDGNDDNAAVKFGAGTGARVANTDAVLTVSGMGQNGVRIVEHTVNAAQMKLNTTDHGFKSGDILMACNSSTASIFQITNIQANTTAVHNSGTGSPGNCTKGLGYRPSPANCTNPLGYLEDFTGGSIVAFRPTLWFVGNNDRGGRSLFRHNLRSGTSEEVVENVTDMQLFFLLRNATTKALAADYVAPSSISDWTNTAASLAVATRLELTLQTREAIDTGRTTTETVSRKSFSSIQVRSRETL